MPLTCVIAKENLINVRRAFQCPVNPKTIVGDFREDVRLISYKFINLLSNIRYNGDELIVNDVICKNLIGSYTKGDYYNLEIVIENSQSINLRFMTTEKFVDRLDYFLDPDNNISPDTKLHADSDYSITYTPEQIKILCSLANAKTSSKSMTFAYSMKSYPKMKLLKFINNELMINNEVITKITTTPTYHDQIGVIFYNMKRIVFKFSPIAKNAGIFATFVKNSADDLLMLSDIIEEEKKIIPAIEYNIYSITYTPKQKKILCSLANVKTSSEDMTFIYNIRSKNSLSLLKFIDDNLVIRGKIITFIKVISNGNNVAIRFYEGPTLVLSLAPFRKNAGIFATFVNNTEKEYNTEKEEEYNTEKEEKIKEYNTEKEEYNTEKEEEFLDKKIEEYNLALKEMEIIKQQFSRKRQIEQELIDLENKISLKRVKFMHE